MPSFAIEVTTLMAPTEIYEQLGDQTPQGWDKETRVFVVVATYRNTINWLVLGEMNKDSQKFRDEIYLCASRAHNTLERGCGKYYRGTNSVHVKRLHSDPFESMYNHNHYPLGGLKGADFDAQTTPMDVTPDEFRQHILAFAQADKEMHAGVPRFLSAYDANRIAAEFRKNYEKEIAAIDKGKDEQDSGREYTKEDLEELKLHQHEEQPCKAPEGVANTRGIGSERADERQPPEYDRKDYEYVKEFREKGKKLLQNVEETVRMIREQKEMQTVLKEAVKSATTGSPVEIASSAFTQEVVEEIALHAKVGVILAERHEKETATHFPDEGESITDYNLRVIDILKEQLQNLNKKKSSQPKSTLPGFKQIATDVQSVKEDTITALIIACEKHYKGEQIDFDKLVNAYREESDNGIPLEFVESLKTTISQVETPVSTRNIAIQKK